MAGEFFLKLLIVSSIFLVYCEDTIVVVPYSERTKKLIEEAKTSKHHRCFTPHEIHCKKTKYPGYAFQMNRWYYSVIAKVCFPIILKPGGNRECAGLVDWIVNLPYTKKECEKLCGEPCTVVHANRKTEPGICMINCAIPTPNDQPFPCHPSYYGCCPRNYDSANTPMPKQPYDITSIFNKIVDTNIYAGFIANVTMNKHQP